MSAPAYICGKELEKLHGLIQTARSAIAKGKLRKTKATISAALEITTTAVKQADAQRERAP